MLGAVSFASINIDNCTILNESGETYLLTADIENVDAVYCMDIEANNVTLECSGHAIAGNDTSNSVGIYVNASSNNVMSNCTISHWDYAIRLFNGNGGNTIVNCSIGNSSYGVLVQGFTSSGNFIHHNRVADMLHVGLYLYTGVASNVLSNNIIDNCTDAGLDLYITSSGNVLLNNTVSRCGCGVELNSVGNSIANTFSGNIFNNTDNVCGYPDSIRVDEVWSYNLWTYYVGNGYSDICDDNNTDMICDVPYDVVNDVGNSSCSDGMDCYALVAGYYMPTTTTTTTTTTTSTTTTTVPTTTTTISTTTTTLPSGNSMMNLGRGVAAMICIFGALLFMISLMFAENLTSKQYVSRAVYAIMIMIMALALLAML